MDRLLTVAAWALAVLGIIGAASMWPRDAHEFERCGRDAFAPRWVECVQTARAATPTMKATAVAAGVGSALAGLIVGAVGVILARSRRQGEALADLAESVRLMREGYYKPPRDMGR